MTIFPAKRPPSRQNVHARVYSSELARTKPPSVKNGPIWPSPAPDTSATGDRSSTSAPRPRTRRRQAHRRESVRLAASDLTAASRIAERCVALGRSVSYRTDHRPLASSRRRVWAMSSPPGTPAHGSHERARTAARSRHTTRWPPASLITLIAGRKDSRTPVLHANEAPRFLPDATIFRIERVGMAHFGRYALAAVGTHGAERGIGFGSELRSLLRHRPRPRLAQDTVTYTSTTSDPWTRTAYRATPVARVARALRRS